VNAKPGTKDAIAGVRREFHAIPRTPEKHVK